MSTPLSLTADPTSGPVPQPVPTDDAAIRALAAQLNADSTPSAPPLTLSQATIVDIAVDGVPPTASITIAGSATQVDGVRFMSGYMPVIGDTVSVLKQNGSVLILGHTVDIGTATAATGGWVAPTLSSGFTTQGNSNGPIEYRMITDNGVFKMQWKGSVAHTGANTAIISGAGALAVLFRPAFKVSLLTARDPGGGSNDVGLDFGTDGTVTLVGPTTHAATVGDFGQTSADTQSTVGHSHGGAVALSTITHDDGFHAHVLNSHFHATSDPTWVSFNNVEYFL